MSVERALLVCTPGPFGGAERVVLGAAAGLRAAGIDVGVLALDVGCVAGAFAAEAVRLRIEVDVLPLRGRFSWSVVRRIAAARASVLLTHGARSLLHAVLTSVPIVHTFHGFCSTSKRRTRAERLEVLLAHRAAAVVAVSAPLAHELSADGLLVDVVENAVTLPATTWPPRARSAAAPLRLLFLGRLAPEKGPDLLLQALQRCTVPFDVVIAGDGPLRAELEAQAPPHVRFVGFVDAAAALADADALVLPSRTEGTPLALLEAAAVGLPVLATAVGGVPALVPEVAGVFPTADVDAIAAALALLHRDHARLADEARQKAPRLVSRFGPAEQARKLRRVMDRVADSSGAHDDMALLRR